MRWRSAQCRRPRHECPAVRFDGPVSVLPPPDCAQLGQYRGGEAGRGGSGVGAIDPAGSPFQDAELAVVKPYHGAATARIDNRVARAVVGVRVHLRPAGGAGDAPFELVPVDWNGLIRRTAPPCSPMLHHIREVVIGQEDPPAGQAVQHRLSIEGTGREGHVAHRASLLARLPEGHQAVVAVLRRGPNLNGGAVGASIAIAALDKGHRPAAALALHAPIVGRAR